MRAEGRVLRSQEGGRPGSAGRWAATASGLWSNLLCRVSALWRGSNPENQVVHDH